MSTLDLKAHFEKNLRARGLPSADQSQCLKAFNALLEFLQDTPADQWTESDLNSFLKIQSRRLNASEKRTFNTTVIIVHELVAQAERDGTPLYLAPILRPKLDLLGPRPAQRRRSDQIVGNTLLGVDSRARDRDAPFSDAERAALALLGDAPDPAELSLPPLDLPEPPPPDLLREHPDASPFGDGGFDLLDHPLSDDDGGLDLLDHPLDGGPELSQAPSFPEPLEAAQDDLLASSDFDLVDGSSAQGLMGSGFDQRELSQLVTHDGEGGAVLRPADMSEARRAAVSREMENTGNRPRPEASVSRRAPRATLPEAWSCPLEHVVWDDGRVCVDQRYVVGVSWPDPSTFLPPPAAALPVPWKQGLRNLQTPIVLTLIGLVTSTVFLGVLPLLGVLLLLLALTALTALGVALARTHSVGQRALPPTDPESALRTYLAALRVRLEAHARSCLAVSEQAEVAELREFIDPDREPLGARFNTASPSLLKRYWSSRIADFDEEGSAPQALFLRYFKPTELTLIEALRNDELGITLMVVRARGIDSFAVAPILRLGDAFFLMDGELTLHSGRQTILAYHAQRLERDELSASGLLDLCRRHNITRADAEAAHRAGLIEDRAWEALDGGLE